MPLEGLPTGITSSNCFITTSASITNSSVLVVGANPNRKGFIVWNNSANSVYLSFATTSSSATPTYILGAFTSWVYQGLIIYQGPISGIRNTGSGTVTVYELL